MGRVDLEASPEEGEEGCLDTMESMDGLTNLDNCLQQVLSLEQTNRTLSRYSEGREVSVSLRLLGKRQREGL